MSRFVNDVKFLSTTAGTASFTIGTAVSGFQLPTAAQNYVTGQLYSYSARTHAGQFESGTGICNGTTQARTTVKDGSAGAGVKVNFTDAPTVILTVLDTDLREVLTDNTTYYVSTTGSDATGNGTASKPWATLDQANEYLAANVDAAGNRIFIQMADGTYSSTYPGQIQNAFQFIVQGNTSDATKVIIQDDGYAGFDVNQGGPMVFQLRWLTVQQVNGGDPIIMDGSAAFLQVANCIIDGGTGAGAPTGIFLQAQQDILNFGFDYNGSGAPNTIKGNYGSFFGAHSTGNFIHGDVTTISGTPAFSNAFISLDNLSLYNEAGSYVNAASATGLRYIVSANSVFNSNGQGTAYLPGNSAGTTATGGQYI